MINPSLSNFNTFFSILQYTFALTCINKDTAAIDILLPLYFFQTEFLDPVTYWWILFQTNFAYSENSGYSTNIGLSAEAFYYDSNAISVWDLLSSKSMYRSLPPFTLITQKLICQL